MEVCDRVFLDFIIFQNLKCCNFSFDLQLIMIIIFESQNLVPRIIDFSKSISSLENSELIINITIKPFEKRPAKSESPGDLVSGLDHSIPVGGLQQHHCRVGIFYAVGRDSTF